MRVHLFAAVILFGYILGASPAVRAHHSFCAEFDTSKRLSFTGTVTKVEWRNPHVWVYLRVKNDKGVVEEWGVTTALPPHVLEREGRGWTKETLAVGDEISIQAAPAKNGEKRAGLWNVTLKGKTLFEGRGAC